MDQIVRIAYSMSKHNIYTKDEQEYDEQEEEYQDNFKEDYQPDPRGKARVSIICETMIFYLLKHIF